jgi:hypothetical protein
MANVLLPVFDVTDAGLDDSTANLYTGSLLTTNVYQIPNDGRIIIHVKNAGASPCVVTFTPGNPGVRGHALATISVSVTNAKNFFIAKFAQNLYNDVNGLINFALSYITSVTIAVLRV